MTDVLTAETGMSRGEIEARREMALLKLHREISEETAVKIDAVQKEVNSVCENVTALRNEGRATAEGFDKKLDQLLRNQEDILAEQAEQKDRLSHLEGAALTPEEITEGRKVFVKLGNWRGTLTDGKKIILSLVGGWGAYKLVGGWFAAHGITWAQLFVEKH